MWLIALALILLIAAAPVMIAARIVGAGRTGFWASLGAVIVSNIIVGVATAFFHRLGLLALFVAPLGYMWVLDTTYPRALAIELIQFAIVLGLALALMLTAIGSAFHLKDMFRHLETGPVQSV